MERTKTREALAVFAADLPRAIQDAEQSENVRGSEHPETIAAWKHVATLAGNIQRRARPLAGLGRGG